MRYASVLWLTVLLLNAAGGLKALSFERYPYSQGRDAARWIEREQLSDAYIIGSRDSAVSTVAGYLRRPIYYLECECRSTFVVWNARRRSIVDYGDLARRTLHAIQSSGRNEAILVLNSELTPEQETATPGLVFERLAQFTGAIVTTENYSLYRVRLR